MGLQPQRSSKAGHRTSKSLGSWGRDFGRHARFLNRESRFNFDDVGPRENRFKQTLRWFGRIFILGFACSILAVTLYGWMPIPFTPLMVIRAAQSVVTGHSPLWSRDWVSLKEISPRMQVAVIAAEDARFFDHIGFDFEAINRAIVHNQRSTRRLRGGSTITQQVAKNVFLWPARSWIRKAAEAYFTVLIELAWSKKRIMEVYLNVVEFGDGVYGVEAAAQKYFKKPAAKLNIHEASLLASVLPNPHRFLVGKPSGYVRFRQSMIQRRSRNVILPKH